jgi:hypothetical protein
MRKKAAQAFKKWKDKKMKKEKMTQAAVMKFHSEIFTVLPFCISLFP